MIWIKWPRPAHGCRARKACPRWRVLRPGGSLLFIEHGQAPDPRLKRWQDRLTPLWRRVAGGCHLNRPIARLIEDAGLRLTELDRGYLLAGPRVLTFHYRGQATSRA